MKVPTFSDTWFLLQQEGYLAHSCLCNGLTALRQANIGDKKGLFYSAFFELSIGFERTLKLILILNHMARNQLVAPDSKTVEHYGHKLIALFDSARAICTARGLAALDIFDQDSLAIVILRFLDSFAHPSGRYSNINKLTGNKHKSITDPIAKWGEIADKIMRDDATPFQRKRADLNGELILEQLDGAAISLISDMNQGRMDIARLHSRASELDTASRHAIYALVTLISALREVIASLCYSASEVADNQSGTCDVPDMAEFFQFAWAERQYVMRKRRWP